MTRPVRIAMRVDGGNLTGMGHIVECLALARSLRKRANCEISFVTTESPPAVSRVNPECDSLYALPATISKADEIDRTRQFCREKEIDILVVDLLRKGEGYYASLKDCRRLLVAILDDDQRRSLPCDVVINFHIGQRQEFYSQLNSNSTQYLVGCQYVLLDENYHREWEKEKLVPFECQSIFVNQGGSDPYGLTAKTLRALQDLRLTQRVIVVAGPAVTESHLGELEGVVSSFREDFEMLYDVDSALMREIMARADLAITAAGNTLYELAALGVPCLILCHHERHNLVASHFAQRGAAVNLGVGTRLSNEEIGQAVASLLADYGKRADLSAEAKRITDGNGAARVAEALLQRALR